jgi:predicted NACHT family NTPase
MSKRSLRASLSGIKEAKKAFIKKGWTQEALALEVNIRTRQPLWRFFTGQPIERYTFQEICLVLDLDWRSIAQIEEEATIVNPVKPSLSSEPLTPEQIPLFIEQCFRASNSDVQKFLESFQSLENSKLKRILVFPLFLQIACWIFEDQGSLPNQDLEFYQQSLDVLLVRWKINYMLTLGNKLEILSNLTQIIMQDQQPPYCSICQAKEEEMQWTSIELQIFNQKLYELSSELEQMRATILTAKSDWSLGVEPEYDIVLEWIDDLH